MAYNLIARDVDGGGGEQVLIPDADITASGVLSLPALDLPSQGGRPADLGFGLWNNGGALTHYTGAADYAVSHANTAFGGDVSGTIGSTVVTLASTDLTDTANLLRTTTSFSGDVSGNYNSTVVADDSHAHTSGTLTLGGIKSLSDVWNSMAQSDGQVLYWDNANSRWDAKTVAGGVTTLSGLSDTAIASPLQYQTIQWDGTNSWDNEWPAMVNESANRTFVVLPAGSTVAAINTALTNYDVVYLEPGNYNFTTSAITVPDGKRLIGLGSFATANPVALSWSGSPASRHILLQNGWIENLLITLSGVAHTSNAVEGNTAQDRNVVRRVRVTASTATGIYGFSGEFTEISEFVTSDVNGVSLTGIPAIEGVPGTVRLDRFYIYAAPTYGMVLLNVSDAVFSNGTIEGNSGVTDYGIRGTANTRLKFENITIIQPATTGVDLYTSGNDITLRDIKVFGKTGTTDRGIYISAQHNVVIDDCYAEYCNGTSGVGYGGILITGSSTEVHISGCMTRLCSNTNNSGILVDNGTVRVTIDGCTSYQDYDAFYIRGNYGTVTGCTAYDPSYRGFYIYSVTGGSFSGLASYSAGNIGVSVSGVTRSSFSAITSADSASYGIYGTAMDDCSFSGITSYNSSNTGIKFSNTCDRNSISGAAAYSSGTQGIVFEGTRWTACGLTSSYNSGYGVWILCPNSTIGCISAHNNSSYGVVGHGNADYTLVHDISARTNTTYDIYFPAIGGTYSFLHGTLSGGGKDSIHSDWGWLDARFN